MSALDDIRAHLGKLQAVRKGFDRVVFVGNSAARSITAVVEREDQPKSLFEEIDGVIVRSTMEFEGWAVREIGPAGIWEDSR